MGVLHPTFESWGGAEWFIHGVLNALIERYGFSVVLYTHRWMAPEEVNPRYEVIEHRLGGVFSGPWDWNRITRKHRDRWVEHDVLFAHNHPSLEWVGRMPNTPPVVWYCHEPPRHVWEAEDCNVWRMHQSLIKRIRHSCQAASFYGGGIPWRLLSKACLSFKRRRGGGDWIQRLQSWDRTSVSRCRTILANSSFTAKRILELYNREATVVYPLLPRFEVNESDDVPTEKEPMVLWVGRLAPAKCPLLMLEAWERVMARLSGFRLVMVGDGPLREEVRERMASLTSRRSVQLEADIPWNELRELYRRALLTVHLAREEPFGLVPLESMWMGTPVLAVCEGGVTETVLPGRTGWCLERFGVEGVAQRLGSLLESEAELCRMAPFVAEETRRRFRFTATVEEVSQSLLLASAGGRETRES